MTLLLELVIYGSYPDMKSNPLEVRHSLLIRTANLAKSSCLNSEKYVRTILFSMASSEGRSCARIVFYEENIIEL